MDAKDIISTGTPPEKPETMPRMPEALLVGEPVTDAKPEEPKPEAQTPIEVAKPIAPGDLFTMLGTAENQPGQPAPVSGAQPTPSEAPPTEEKKGPGRPKGSKNKNTGVPDFSAVPTLAEAATTDHKAIAGMLFDVTTGSLAAMIGPEWKPKNADERGAIIEPLALYLKSKDVQDVPPGMLLAIAICAYSAQRFAEPNTRGFFLKLWDKTKLTFHWLKVKFANRKKQ